jgi:hypothetical protein
MALLKAHKLTVVPKSEWGFAHQVWQAAFAKYLTVGSPQVCGLTPAQAAAKDKELAAKNNDMGALNFNSRKPGQEAPAAPPPAREAPAPQQFPAIPKNEAEFAATFDFFKKIVTGDKAVSHKAGCVETYCEENWQAAVNDTDTQVADITYKANNKVAHFLCVRHDLDDGSDGRPARRPGFWSEAQPLKKSGFEHPFLMILAGIALISWMDPGYVAGNC